MKIKFKFKIIVSFKGKPGTPTVADGKVGAELNSDPSDNIPLRIMLLFMDEVFDLQERNQWLRRQIVSVLRQLVKAMFGKNYSSKQSLS
jgi:sorting nexin-13